MTTRELRQERGRSMRTRLFGAQKETDRARVEELLPGFSALSDELIFGEIWARPGLATSDRMICTLAALGALERLPQLRRSIGAALRIGIQPRGVVEVLLQSGLYAGFSVTENTIEIAHEVFAEHGAAVAPDLDPEATVEHLHSRGAEVLRRLHGARGEQGYASPDNPVTGALYRLAIEYGYGMLWYRPGLEMRERALVAVAAFTAMRLEDQVRKFGESALSVGLTATEVQEAIIQTAPYTGFPPALNALAALSDVLSANPASADGVKPTR